MAMIDPQIVQKIVDAARVEDVVRSYGVVLHKAGTVLKGLCPFHEEKTPSFVVSPAKGIYKCFGCGKGGHAVNFVMEKEQCSYPEALRILAKRYNIEVPEREMTPEERTATMERQNILAINEWLAARLTEMLTTDDEARAIGLSYFRTRQFSDRSILSFRLGYSPDRNRMVEEARKAGFRDDIIIKSGLGGRSEARGTLYDRFRGRVMFPIVNLSGKVVAFGGRIVGQMTDEEKRRGRGKYVNSPEIPGIYEKNRELYGLYQAKQEIQRRDQCILVEGYADVISMHQAGMRNTVAACGTAFTENQMNVIRRFTNNLIVMDDGDQAGIHAAQKAANIALSNGMNVRLILLPDGSDPDDFARQNSAEVIEKYIADEAMDFVAYKHRVLLEGRHDDPIAVKEALDSVLQTIAILPDAMTRAIYTRRASEIFGIAETALTPTLETIENRNLDQQADEQQRQQRRQRIEQEARKQEQQLYPFHIREEELVRYIVRNATEQVHVATEQGIAEVRLMDMLLSGLSELDHDGRIFANPKYQKFIDIIRQEEISDPNYFINHADPEIQQTAIGLAVDRDEPSKIFINPDEQFKVAPDDPQYEQKRANYDLKQRQKREKELIDQLETLIKEYLIEILVARQAELRAELRVEPDKLKEIMQELTRLKHIEQQLRGEESPA